MQYHIIQQGRFVPYMLHGTCTLYRYSYSTVHTPKYIKFLTLLYTVLIVQVQKSVSQITTHNPLVTRRTGHKLNDVIRVRRGRTRTCERKLYLVNKTNVKNRPRGSYDDKYVYNDLIRIDGMVAS